MKNLNIEIKAQTVDHYRIRRFLIDHHASYKGLDHQIDTYFTVPMGRLKIREGTIESCLVYYNRADDSDPKRCDYIIEHYSPGDARIKSIKDILCSSLGIIAVIEKKREIYFIGNVKFHLDTVVGLGTFFEIEAIGRDGVDEKELRCQCAHYLEKLGITARQLVKTSYSDMLIKE